MMAEVVWHEGQVSRQDREGFFGQKNKVLWFTGLSGSGKSTVARVLEKLLWEAHRPCYVLDGDNIRHGLNSDLGFSKKDRGENIRRIAEVARLFYDAGLYVLVCFISPYRKERGFARKLIGRDFVEIYVDCPIGICEKRDPKGMYRRARAGKIRDFTGVNDPYEAPKSAELRLDTSKGSPEACAARILEYIGEKL